MMPRAQKAHSPCLQKATYHFLLWDRKKKKDERIEENILFWKVGCDMSCFTCQKATKGLKWVTLISVQMQVRLVCLLRIREVGM